MSSLSQFKAMLEISSQKTEDLAKLAKLASKRAGPQQVVSSIELAIQSMTNDPTTTLNYFRLIDSLVRDEEQRSKELKLKLRLVTANLFISAYNGACSGDSYRAKMVELFNHWVPDKHFHPRDIQPIRAAIVDAGHMSSLESRHLNESVSDEDLSILSTTKKGRKRRSFDDSHQSQDSNESDEEKDNEIHSDASEEDNDDNQVSYEPHIKAPKAEDDQTLGSLKSTKKQRLSTYRSQLG